MKRLVILLVEDDANRENQLSGDDISVLVLSGKSDSKDMFTEFEVDGDPFDLCVLLSRVEAHLQSHAKKERARSSHPSHDEIGEPQIKLVTKREKEILSLIKEGYTNQEIALYYRLSLGTIKGYNNSLFRKLGAKNRTHAIRLAFELGILQKT